MNDGRAGRGSLGGMSMGGDGGGRAPQGGAAEGSGDRGSRKVRGPLGTFWRAVADGVAEIRWELPEGTAREAARALAAASGLRGHVRKFLYHSDGTVSLADSAVGADGQRRDEESLEAWRERQEGSAVAAGEVFAFVHAMAEMLDAAAKLSCIPQRFVPGCIRVLTDADGGREYMMEEFAVADAVRRALRTAGRPTDEEAGDAVWRAPERQAGAAATAASNQWALARMAYWMLLPGRMEDGAPRTLRKLDAGQNAALKRALSPDPAARFRRCADFAAMLETGKLPGSGGAGRRIGAVAALLVAAGVAAGAWWVWRTLENRAELRISGGGGPLEALPEKTLSEEARAKLEEAVSAKTARDWAACLAAARAVLAEDPEHGQARALAAEAEEASAPWLRIEADRPGAWIVRAGTKVRLPTSVRLERGAKAGPWDVRAEDGGRTWSGFVPEFTVDAEWTGERTRLVRLAAGEAGAGTERKRRTVRLPGGKTFAMIWCPPGTFRTGGHEVQLTKGFWLAEHEFTVGEWKTLRARSPSSIAAWNNRRKHPALDGVDGRPVDNVPWDECQSFIGELNASGCDLDLEFRLPTEAEWEYASRAGGTEGDGETPDAEAWYEKTAKSVRVIDRETNVVTTETVPPHPAGEKKANGWGFFDMLGNVSEWCSDEWEPGWWERQPAGVLVDPSGPQHGEGHVVRGGNVRSPARDCTRSARAGAPKAEDGFGRILAPLQTEDRTYHLVGFRLAADETD
ncbi:MAG: SUMF1/EgtB/PvdO family nonheme iron enzyme [Kiritimatiellae bacterium]|nr:SUMF1/EgtB/PvdO family nonheme iron enzyme [Kiritimatiellia bacterium]